MTIPRRVIPVLVLLISGGQSVCSQKIDIGIFHAGGPTLEVRLRANDTIPGWPFSNIVFTIRWLDSYGVTLGVPSSATYSIATQGPMSVSGNYRYQKFAAATAQYVFWSANTEIPVMTVDVSQTSSGTGTFELADDTWTGSNRGDFYAELSGLDRTGIIYQTAASNVVLPLELVSMQAAWIDGAVHLAWRTSGETHGTSFIVERCTDSRQWVTIGTVPAFAAPEQDFRFVDRMLSVIFSDGMLTYRIVHIESDGRRSPLGDLSVAVGGSPVVADELAVFPNPAAEHVRLRVVLAQAATAALTIHDVSGRMMRRLVDGPYSSGVHLFPVSLGGFPPGLYVLRLRTAAGIIARPLMVSR